MRCIDCEEKTTRVYSSNVNNEGVSCRHRACVVCGARFKTEEVVMKRLGNTKKDFEAEKSLNAKINGNLPVDKIKYNKMLEPVPILDKDIDL